MSLKFWEVKTVDEHAWGDSVGFLEGKSVAEAIETLSKALETVPPEYRELAYFEIDRRDGYGDEKIELVYTRPKNAEELASDERQRLASYQEKLDRAKRNYDEAAREMEQAKAKPPSQS